MADQELVKTEDDARTRKSRPTGSMHMGDVDFNPDDPAYMMDATWGEVCKACCVHTPEEWGYMLVGILCVCFFLYFFLFGLELLGAGAKVMGGCTAGELFGDDTNPIAGLMIGILATVLLQSSSTTTSIVVSLVGAGSVSVRQGIYMIMGSNIGTSVTNTIVAIGHLGNGDQLERAFAGATVHDMFNFLAVAILLPLEAASGYLYWLTLACVKNFSAKDGEKWEGPVKKIVAPLSDMVIIANKKVIEGVANGENCTSFYPIVCDNMDNPTYETCSRVGLISCDKDTDECPAFFQSTADKHDDQMSGLCVFIIGLAVLFVCLYGLVMMLQKMLLGTSTRIIYKATNINGYLAMILGALITIVVQSSSITTSALTPLVGMGILRLEQMFPLTLGANVGTTITALLAAMLSDANAMQVALAHLFFNLSGIVIWYPVPFMRAVPLHAARQLGKGTRIWRGFPVLYIIVMFFIVPLLFLGISFLFTEGSKGLTVLGSLFVVILGIFFAWLAYYCQYKGGKENCYECMAARQVQHEALKALPDDMVFLKEKIKLLCEHTGLPTEDEEDLEGQSQETAGDVASDKEEPKSETPRADDASTEEEVA